MENHEVIPASTTAPAVTATAPAVDAPVVESEVIETPEQIAAKEADEAAKREKEETRKKNRTTAYIERTQQKVREQEEELRQLRETVGKLNQPKPTPGPIEGEPRLADYNYDIEAFQRAHSNWTLDNFKKSAIDSAKQAETERKTRELAQNYDNRLNDFVADHPDFPVAIANMRIVPPQDFQLAIMAHEQGPAIAYHLAQNEDDLLALVQTPVQYAEFAVAKLASRLKAAPQEPPTPNRSISQAPTPVPSVQGRAPTKTPVEKLTDDEWYARQKAERRKK
jgi:hypothetical protein